MRYIPKLFSILVGILLAFLIISISHSHLGSTAFTVTAFYVIGIFLILYFSTIYWLQRYKTIPYYNVMTKLRPDSAVVFNNRGLGYLRRGDYEPALQDLQFALRLNPNLGIAYINRGLVYLGLKQYEKSLQDFNQAQQLKPEKANVYFGRGALYSTMKRYQEAQQDFDRALELRPRSLSFSAYLGKAMVYAHLKDYQQALQECEHAITLAPRNAQPYLVRGDIHLGFDHFQEALQDFEHIIQVSSSSAAISIQYGLIVKCQVAGYINCGAVYIELKEYQKAIQHIEQAMALDSQCSQAYYARGMAYLWLNDMERARSDIEQSWKLNAHGCSYGLVLAWLDLCEVKPNQNISEHLEAIGALDEMDYHARVSRGIAQWIQGHHEEALATLRQYIDTELSTGYAYFWSGVVYASLGQNDEANTMLQYALEQHLPPSLLAPLHWLEEENPLFYLRYALPLLNGQTG